MATNRGLEPLRVFNPGYRLAIWRNTYSANSSYGGKYKNRTYVHGLTVHRSTIELIPHVLDPFFLKIQESNLLGQIISLFFNQ